jgi:DNA-binding CsgD family transcriptional regulator
VHAGASQVSPRISQGQIEEVLSQRARNPYGLSDREVTAVKMYANGYDTSKVASLMKVSGSTIANIMQNAMSLMECDTRHQVGPRWIREQELEPMRERLNSAVNLIEALGGKKMREHPTTDSLRRAAKNGLTA